MKPISNYFQWIYIGFIVKHSISWLPIQRLVVALLWVSLIHKVDGQVKEFEWLLKGLNCDGSKHLQNWRSWGMSAVVSVYQKCSNWGTVISRRQGQGQPMHMHVVEWRMAHVIWSRRATVTQIAEWINTGSNRTMSEYTVHYSCRSVLAAKLGSIQYTPDQI